MMIKAPMLGAVVRVLVKPGDAVRRNDVLLILEAMKVQTSIVAPADGQVKQIVVAANDTVEQHAALIELDQAAPAETEERTTVADSDSRTSATDPLLTTLHERLAKTGDAVRRSAADKRHAKGYRTARENLAALCDPDDFVEYGQLAVAAQRGRSDYEELQSATAADGIITGIGRVNADTYDAQASKTALIINDYSVLAGTQGYYHHKKLDRMLAVAQAQRLPVIMYTEGGGGRPGDTDVTTVNSGLECQSFGSWAALAGKVLRIGVANGYNFAGNAALFGTADITIATRQSWIGMAGPAMIAGGGLGDFKPQEIGPINVQTANGVVDLVADDENHAAALAAQCLSYFQGAQDDYQAASQDDIGRHMPASRRATYAVRDIVAQLMDRESFLEIRADYGGAIVCGFARLQGRAIGVMANDCMVLGGAIDVAAGEKAADFMQLCNDFDLPVLSLCDTPGFMVGPEHEERGAVRRLAKMFTAGARLGTPLAAIVLRKCYGLGAQAMVGGSTARPGYIAAWPSGEFGPMGLEGAVKLGFKKELEGAATEEQREELYQRLLAQQYQQGQAIEVATSVEIDAVIDPAQTRARLAAFFQN